MSTIIKNITILLFFLSIHSFSQKREKDSIFFFFDENYTINSSIVDKLTYSKYKEMVKSKIDLTNTNGYIHFFEEKELTKITPKKIFNIKDYIENSNFYFDGKHNKIVDNWKIKKYLLEKYTVFLVKGNKVIKIKSLTYNSYYPLKKGNKYIDKRNKDTLVFKFDSRFLKKVKSKSSNYFMVKDNNDEDAFGFIINKKIKNWKNKKTIHLKEFFLTSHYYNKEKNKIDKLKLATYLNNYMVFIKTENNCYKVKSYFEVYSML